jgi:hypothetical protein
MDLENVMLVSQPRKSIFLCWDRHDLTENDAKLRPPFSSSFLSHI